MKLNAPQAFWNGSPVPLGYVLVEVEKRGTKIKKTLAIDPVDAETVQLIFKPTVVHAPGIRSLLRCERVRGGIRQARYRHAPGSTRSPSFRLADADSATLVETAGEGRGEHRRHVLGYEDSRGVGRESGQKFLQCLHTSCRCADRDQAFRRTVFETGRQARSLWLAGCQRPDTGARSLAENRGLA